MPDVGGESTGSPEWWGPGAVVGKQRYQIGEWIAGGGFGDVWRATDSHTGGWVAIKAMRPDANAKPETQVRDRQRFLREASATHALTGGTGIVPVSDWGEHGGRPFLVMKFIEGRTLARVLWEDAPLDPSRTVAILSQVADALDYAHNRSRVHRDIKPSNVLVEHDGGRDWVWVTDFGLVGLTDSAPQSRPTPTAMIGSYAYMPPERFRRATAGLLDRRIDVYALGCLLHVCLTGEPAFQAEADDWFQYADAHQADDRPRPSRALGASPTLAQFDGCVLRALDRDLEERTGSAATFKSQMLEALANWRTVTSGGPPPAGPPERSSHPVALPTALPQPSTPTPGRATASGPVDTEEPGPEPGEDNATDPTAMSRETSAPPPDRFVRWARETLGSQDRVVIHGHELDDRFVDAFGVPERWARTTELLEALDDDDIGLDPDVRFDEPLRTTGAAVVFGVPGRAARGASTTYRTARVALEILVWAATRAGADAGEIATAIDPLVPTAHLDDVERARFGAHTALVLTTPMDVDDIGTRAQVVPLEERRTAVDLAVARFAGRLDTADGRAEVRTLCQALGLPTNATDGVVGDPPTTWTPRPRTSPLHVGAAGGAVTGIAASGVALASGLGAVPTVVVIVASYAAGACAGWWLRTDRR